MFNISNLYRNATAALGAVLISFTFIGAAVGPVTNTPAAVSGQAPIA